MKCRKYSLLLLLFFCICFGILPAQRRDSTSQQTSPASNQIPTKKSSGEKDAFWRELQKNIENSKRQKDSLNKYYQDHPVETRKYVTSYLIAKRILPNTDAIDLVKAMNPQIRNLSEINFYTILRMPVFKKMRKPDRKRLKNECKALLKFDRNEQNNFIALYRKFQTAKTQYSNTQVSFAHQNAKLAFDHSLSLIYSYLNVYSGKRLPKGTAIFMSNETTMVTKLLIEIINKRSTSDFHVRILDAIRNNMHFNSMLGNLAGRYSNEMYNSAEIQSKRMGLFFESNTHSLSALGEGLPAELPYEIFTTPGNGDATVKTCEIYAKRPSTNVHAGEVDIAQQYFFSFQSFGNAVYNCKYDQCSGFNEGPHLISVNGANVVPGNYVFRFLDKSTRKYYYSCITKDLFELIEGSKTSRGKSRYRIIFNPDSPECNEYIW